MRCGAGGLSVTEMYLPKLNESGLFAAKDDAISCCRWAMSIQDDFPNFFEAGDLEEFVPTGIYRVG